MNMDFIEDEFLIKYFRINLLRKLGSLLTQVVATIALFTTFFLMLTGEYTINKNINIFQEIMIVGCILGGPFMTELRVYKYIRNKRFKIDEGVCTNKDYDILPKYRGIEIVHSVDVQNHITGESFNKIKVPRYIYTKVCMGDTCAVITINLGNKEIAYIYPTSYYAK